MTHGAAHVSVWGLHPDEIAVWARLHPPEKARNESTLAHKVLGLVISSTASAVLLAANGLFTFNASLSIWPGLAIFVGASSTLLVFLFHHGFGKARLSAKVYWYDSKERQHVLWVIVTALIGVGEVLGSVGALPGFLEAVVFPAGLVTLGILFWIHPAHGTPEAAREQRLYHRFMAIGFGATGVLQAVRVFLPSILESAWGIALLLTGLLFLLYQEPGGGHVGLHREDE